MNYDSNKKFSVLVEDFYIQEKKVQKPLGMPLFDILRKFLPQELKNGSDDEIRAYIKKSYDKYIESNKVPCETRKKDSFDHNMRDWLTDSYKGVLGNFAKNIDRASILTIAFVLEEFSDQMCNEMLLSVNQHPLHRGDASENIIIHCLKEGKSFSHADRIYQCFKYFVSTGTKIDLENSDVSFSERSEFVKRKMALTNIHEGTTEIDFTQEFKNQVVTWKEKNTDEIIFDDKDIQVIKNLIALQNYFNSVSKRTLSSIQKNTEINNLTSRSFFKKIFKPYKNTTSISNVFTSFNNALSDKSLSHPTRAFIIMMGIVSWCHIDTTLTLEEYVDTLLVEELCNFHHLDPAYPEDRFVMELNKYVFEKQNRKKGVIYYRHNDNINYLVDFNYKNNFSTKAEAFQVIINGYFENLQNTLITSDWKKSHQFFDFSTYEPQMEVRNDSSLN